MALSLCLTYFTVYRLVRKDLMNGLDETLGVMANGIASSLELEIGGVFELELREPLISRFKGPQASSFFVIREPSGKIASSSTPNPPEIPHGGQDKAGYETLYLEGRPYRILTMPVPKVTENDEVEFAYWKAQNPGKTPPAPERRIYLVSVGHDMGDVEETLTLFGTSLSWGLGGFFVLLLLIPAVVVSRALNPIKRLSAQADLLGPESANGKLDEEGVDKEIHSLVAALNRAIGRLSEAYRRQKQFTSDAAHELRTPISAIRVQCEVALRKERDAEELKKTLEAVGRASHRLSDIVESLLSLARVQNVAQTAKPGNLVDMADVCEEAFEINRAYANLKNVSLEKKISPGITVRGNETLIVEAVSNLLENAVRYTPGGGRVVLELSNGHDPTVTVTDTGIGIAREHQDRIFERFYCVDKTQAREGGGAGLGLSIVSEIAAMHGAKILVESEPGRGSVFRLRFKV
jgi:signal transduction histidine kinase